MLSVLGLEFDELLRRLRLRMSSGSPGDSPDARAKRFKTSVKLTTPERRPLMAAPGICAALILTPGFTAVKGGPGVISGPLPDRCGRDPDGEGKCILELGEPNIGGEAWIPGLGGTLVDGDGASTIHIRWERVAHSLATAWASVLKGVT